MPLLRRSRYSLSNRSGSRLDTGLREKASTLRQKFKARNTNLSNNDSDRVELATRLSNGRYYHTERSTENRGAESGVETSGQRATAKTETNTGIMKTVQLQIDSQNI